MKKIIFFLMVLTLVCGIGVLSAQEIPEIVIGWVPPDITVFLKPLLISSKKQLKMLKIMVYQ